MAAGAEALLSDFAEVSYEFWRAEVAKGLRGASFEKRLHTRTLESVEIRPLYAPSDLAAAREAVGSPGLPTYRREAASGRAPSWEPRPRFENPDPVRLRSELAAELERGVRSIWLCFDRAVRAGESPVEPPRGAGALGVGCVSAAELAGLLAAVPLERVTLSLDAGGNALAVAACYVHAAQARKLKVAELSAWFNADPLGALTGDGALPCSLARARAQLVALASWTCKEVPNARSVTVSVVPHHDAGAHCGQELGYALATAVTYLRWLTQGGLSLTDACRQLAFSFAVGSDLFMEIAKLRAFRRCFARVVEASGGGAEAQRATVHVTTSSRTKTARDPWVNLLRETTEAFAGAAGGADVITTSGFDRLLGPSDGFARRLAVNTQVILDEEAHVTRVADPAGGSFYVESLTDQLTRLAWRELQAIEAEGGMERALLSGLVASQLRTVAGARAAQYATRGQVITGVSEFAFVEEPKVTRAEPAWAAITASRRAALAGAHDEASLRALGAAGGPGGAASIETAVLAAAGGASLEQLSRALAGPEPPASMQALLAIRSALPYERLRDASDALAQTGKRPAVFLCNLGPMAEHKARAQFASGFFAAGGFAVCDNDGFGDAQAALAAFRASGADLAVLCGSDESYATLAEGLVPGLLAAGAQRVLLAGKPGEHEALYRGAGVSGFVFTGCDVVATLELLLTELGAKP